MTRLPTPNINGIRNGSRLRVPIGNMPAPLRPLGRQVRGYRAELERLVTERHGEISPRHAHEIGAAVEATLHQAICRWLLREKFSSMSAGDILKCSESIVRGGESRNKAIARLNLDPPTAAELQEQVHREILAAQLSFSQQPPAALPEAPPVAPDAAGAAETTQEPSCGESPPETLPIAHSGCDNAETSIGVNNNQKCDIPDEF